MLGRAFGTLAAVTIGANAFLLPPGINSIHSDSVSAFTNPNTQSVKLPCPDCVFSKPSEEITEAEEGADDLFWVQGRDRAVVLNFTLTDDLKAVNINGWQVYPFALGNPEVPHVAEVAATASFADIQDHPEKATTLEVSAAGIFVDEELVSPNGDKIVKVNYHVMSVETQPISVDAAEVKLLVGGDGRMMIISLEAVPSSRSIFDSKPLGRPPPPSHGAPVDKECKMLPAALCKWKSMVESKIGSFKQGPPHKSGGKGCGGRKGPTKLPGHIRPHFDHVDKVEDDDERPRHHHGRPPHAHPHGSHGGSHHRGHPHHHFIHSFVGAFISVLVPVIAGITMGMFVSLVGMVVGRLIAFMWIKFRRGGQRGYASVAQTDADTESMEKGAVDVTEAEEEALPVYEAAPAYAEKE